MNMCSVYKFLIWLFLNFICVTLCTGYLVIVSNEDSPGLVLFDAGVIPQLKQPPRRYSMNVHKSASFVRKILHVDHYTGSVVLKQWLECDGVKYPNLFTIFIDSVSNGTLDYISFPLRILVRDCDYLLDVQGKI